MSTVLSETPVTSSVEGHQVDMVPLERAFWVFHRANPEVYARLVALARQWRAQHPGKKVGIGMLFEVLRWEAALETTGRFKLNNSTRSFYARLIMTEERDLRGVFVTRKLHTPLERS